MAAFDQGLYDEIQMVYSEFKSPMVQTPMIKQLLPVPQPEREDESDIFLHREYIF